MTEPTVSEPRTGPFSLMRVDVERWKAAWIEHRRVAGADEMNEPCTPQCTSLIEEEYARLAART